MSIKVLRDAMAAPRSKSRMPDAEKQQGVLRRLRRTPRKQSGIYVFQFEKLILTRELLAS
jgi:hypothetical protein